VKPPVNKKYKKLTCRVYLVKEKPFAEEVQLNSADAVFMLVRDDLCSSDRERFLSILLTAKNTVIGIETVSIGVLDSCAVTPRELFKSAILANAASIIVCHNHPSGSLEPSWHDKELTRSIRQAGELLGIDLKDHLIVSPKGYYSIVHDTVKEVTKINGLYP
jgi:DNA repair protein RadC